MRCFPIVEFGKPLVEMDLPTPEPGGDEILLRVTGCGVCHSDVHIYDGYFDMGDGKKADLTAGRELPMCLGHEVVGEVVAMGDSASGVNIGDSVVVYPWIGCGECVVCAAGDEHFCPKHRSIGVMVNGGFADHLIVPHSKYLFDHSSVPAEVACTYACSGITAYSAISKAAKAGTGHMVLVGAGGVGLAGLAIARNIVDATITVCDIDDGKLSAAKELGADNVVNSTDKDAVKQVRGLTGGGAAAVVDFVGAAASVGFAMKIVARRGTVVIVGLMGGSLPLSVPMLPLTAMTLTGSYVGSLEEMARVMALARNGKIPSLPVQKRGLSHAQKTLDDLKAGQIVGRVVLAA
ncbi:MAG: alcohol dehydrogenase [Rhodospirillaceae bacterium]|nr:alcohol dehydrogenase [Rhodospirillaceae bacterium]